MDDSRPTPKGQREVYDGLLMDCNFIDSQIMSLQGKHANDEQMYWRMLDMHNLLKRQTGLFRRDIGDSDLLLSIRLLGGILQSYEDTLGEVIAVKHPSEAVEDLKKLSLSIQLVLNKAGYLAW